MFSVAWPFTRLVIEAIRNRFPKVSIVVGGEHVTAAPAFTLETCGAIDYCVLGEGEGPLVSLMTVLEAERSPKHVLSRVVGIMGRVDGRVSCGPPPERIRAIDPTFPIRGALFSNRSRHTAGILPYILRSDRHSIERRCVDDSNAGTLPDRDDESCCKR